MKNFPDTRSMLPSAARQAITEWLLERLIDSPLDCYANPLYTYAVALGELPEGTDGYAWSVFDACWHEARAQYEAQHPKHVSQDSGGACPIRTGLPV